ncbi:hypothetical protein KP003_10825 [Geomonas nitrogeniifigens]|uniref:Uncharacterized protein n=1 Tax=Geomonas diazotrophica TaxID=2843197 RepID=A0ABX8JDG2_9BACT|nr:hypothetical protein [Geomonas nitrogeniifigens]QWV95818.1 hypothetical protein KP005_10465 [Geomonas nitrogeniifigens]QXE84901.1 hypothetical protein KP003_10825 [Geomonas nitrogeniifigens]
MRTLKLHQCQESQPLQLVTKSVMTACVTLVLVSLFALPVSLSFAKEVQQLPHEPNNPKIMQLYFNTTDNREYIYNGQEWVPHDASIDTYQLKKYKKPTVSKSTSNSYGTSTTNTQGVTK